MDETGFVTAAVHIRGHVVTVELRHRYDKDAMTGEKVASIEINQVQSTCSTFGATSEINNLLPKDFVEYISLEIFPLNPVMMEGEELITSCCLL